MELRNELEEQMRLVEEAEALGIDLWYAPEVFIEDIESMSLEDAKPLVSEAMYVQLESACEGKNPPDVSQLCWQATLHCGIGGSSAGAILGLSKYKTPYEAALEFVRDRLPEKPNADLQYVYDYGHALEPILLKLYAARSGLGFLEENRKEGKEYGVYTDRRKYYHPNYPFMVADCDGFAVTPSGERIGIEFKTFNYNARGKWKAGVFGEGGEIRNPEYEIQVRHYMAVLNLNRFDLVANCGNSPDDMIVVTFYRDLAKEKEIIEKEGAFWNDIQNGILPDSDFLTNEQKANAESLLAIPTQEDGDLIELEGMLGDAIAKIASNNELIKKLEENIKEIEGMSNALQLRIEEAIGVHAGGYADRNGMRFIASWKKGQRASLDTKRLKLNHPELAKEYEKVTAYRTFKVTSK